MLAISAALAGPLIYLAGEESGGFHFFGPSSIGKTVTLHAARSVWGVPLSSWRTTDNAAEVWRAVPATRSLTLDEIGQAPAACGRGAGLPAGQPARQGPDAPRRHQPRPASPGGCCSSSTGELGLAARLAEGGKRMMAGQAVRVIEIPADAGARLGIFDH